MQVLWLIPALAGMYVLFILLPSLACIQKVLGRSKKPPRCQTRPGMPGYEAWQRAKTDLDSRPWQEVSVSAKDGVPLHGAFLDQGAARTALCLHGFLASAGNNFAQQGVFLLEEGFNLLFVDHRAHGKSGGRYCTLGLREQEDLLTWLDWLKTRPGGESVLVCGISMGGSTAAFASDRMDGAQVRAMLIDCAYLSPERQIARTCRMMHIPWPVMRGTTLALVRLLLGADLRRSCGDNLKSSRVPALFLYGDADETVPFSEGQELYRACAAPKEWLLIPGAGHALAFPMGGREAENALRRLIRRGFAQIKPEQSEQFHG